MFAAQAFYPTVVIMQERKLEGVIKTWKMAKKIKNFKNKIFFFIKTKSNFLHSQNFFNFRHITLDTFFLNFKNSALKFKIYIRLIKLIVPAIHVPFQIFFSFWSISAQLAFKPRLLPAFPFSMPAECTWIWVTFTASFTFPFPPTKIINKIFKSEN